MPDMKVALNKLSVGDGLTDKELADAIKLFKRMEDDLRTVTRFFDKGYGLTHRAAMHELQRLECFAGARKDKVRNV